MIMLISVGGYPWWHGRLPPGQGRIVLTLGLPVWPSLLRQFVHVYYNWPTFCAPWCRCLLPGAFPTHTHTHCTPLAGVPANVASATLTAPYNDIEAVKKIFAENKGEIAGIILEPVVGNSGFIVPTQGRSTHSMPTL